MTSCPSSSIAVPRVSTLELFFDLVFVFTITQLTSVLVAGGDAAAAVQVVVMLAPRLVDVRRIRVADECDRDGSPALPDRADRRHGRLLDRRARDPRCVRERRTRVRARLPRGRAPARRDVCEGDVGLGGRGDPADRPVQPDDGRAGRPRWCTGRRRPVGALDRGRRPDLVHAVAHRHRRVPGLGVALRRAARPRDHRRARRVRRRDRSRCRRPSSRPRSRRGRAPGDSP